jgi:hypothetical protein
MTLALTLRASLIEINNCFGYELVQVYGIADRRLSNNLPDFAHVILLRSCSVKIALVQQSLERAVKTGITTRR